MIAAKHFDPVLGIDIHIIQPPGPVPPLPIPHPFVGMLIDPTEYVPIIGGTVMINGSMRGVAGTGGKAIPPHIPIGGVFVVPPGNECEMFMGSATVQVDGDPQSRLGDPALSCHSIGMPSIPRLKIHAKPKTLMLPTSVVLAVPMGPPVLVGGPPTISLMGMAMKFGLAALGKVMKKVRALQKGSKKWKAVSDKVHKAADKALDKVPGGKKLKGKAHNAICSLTGHPVDVASGKVTTESTDVELPGPLPFNFSRVWYSQSTYDGPLGHGWHHSYDLGLYRFPEGIVVRLADGRFVVFQPPVPGEPSFDRNEKLFLHLTDRGYHAETLDGLVYHFGRPNQDESERPLDHVRDSNGNTIRLERERGKLVAFIDSGGRRLPVTTDAAGRITEIRVPDPDKPGETYPMVSYQYDRRGDLVRADDALGNPFRYEYLDHLLMRETDRSGLAFYFMYDGSGPDAKCLRTWGDGDLFLRDLSYDDARRRTEVTNSLGHKTVYEWNEGGLVVKETDPLGGTTLTEWSEHNDKLSVTNPNGETTAFAYDDAGRLAAVTDPTGAEVKYEYDASGNQVKFTDPNGSVWKREYDERRNIVGVIDPLGHRRSYELDARGRPVRITDPLGKPLEFGWTVGGQVASFVDRVGNRTANEFDALGRQVRRTTELGSTRYRYDRLGQVIEHTDPTGRIHRQKYNPGGDLVAKSDHRGRTTEYAYVEAGRLASVRSPAGRVTRYRYDTEGDMIEVEAAGRDRWQFIRDAAGRVVEKVTADGRRLRYERDPVGRVIESVNARGQRVAMKRDRAGRVLAQVLPDGTEETFAYTPGGALASARNAAATLAWAYDPYGRVLSERVNGKVVTNQYDAVGNRVVRTSPLGRTLRLEYDGEGHLIAAADGATEVFRSTLDPLGRESRRVTPNGAEWQWDYLPTGETRAVRVNGRTRIERTYEYDPNGNCIGQTDSAFGTDRYAFDDDGFLIGVRHADESGQAYEYDPTGNIGRPAGIAVRRDADGNTVEKQSPRGRWRYEYDPLSRLQRASSDGGAELTFAYDPLGRRVRKTSGAAVTEYWWDGQVTLGETGPAGGGEYLFHPHRIAPLARFDRDGATVLECDPIGLPRSGLTPDGELVWHAAFEPFGEVRAERGRSGHIDVRYPGQVADPETGLSYNYFRYHDPELRSYLTPDPIGPFGGPGVYNYVRNPLQWSDPYGLAEAYKAKVKGEEIDPTKVDVFRGGTDMKVKPGEVSIDKSTGLVKPTHGQSMDTDAALLEKFGGAKKVESIPAELKIIQRGKRDTHFELVPREPMSPERFQELSNQVVLKE